MAHNGVANISASILRDEIKARFSGSLTHVPNISLNQHWIYKTAVVPTSPAALFAVGDEWIANTATTTLAAADKILWVAIKHLGTEDVAGSLKTNDGIMMNYSGTNPVYNGTDGASNNNIVIAPNELFVVKLNGVLQADLRVGTCTLANSVPSQIGTTTVAYQVAAIVEDVA